MLMLPFGELQVTVISCELGAVKLPFTSAVTLNKFSEPVRLQALRTFDDTVALVDEVFVVSVGPAAKAEPAKAEIAIVAKSKFFIVLFP